jgi:hypothetical protein
MWSYEYRRETVAAPEAIWRLWTDVAAWGTWNADIEQVALHGPFAPGGEIAMTPRGQETVRLRLAEVREHQAFVDEAELGGLLVRTFHRLEPGGSGRTRIVYRTEITGQDADTVGAEIGEAITADFPETVAGLIAAAER